MDEEIEPLQPLEAGSRERIAMGLATAAKHASDGDYLAALAWLGALGRVIEAEKSLVVVEARADGRSWAEIGASLRISKQTAFNRYSQESK